MEGCPGQVILTSGETARGGGGEGTCKFKVKIARQHTERDRGTQTKRKIWGKVGEEEIGDMTRGGTE